MIISLIAAVDTKGGIGKENRLPWHLSSDLKRFKQLTTGHYIAMGRKTYDSIGKTLPGRIMLVITHRRDIDINDVILFDSIGSAITYAKDHGENELFIIGGGEIFLDTIDLADRIYLTLVHADCNADVFFPAIRDDAWQVITSMVVDKQAGDDYKTDFKILERKH